MEQQQKEIEEMEIILPQESTAALEKDDKEEVKEENKSEELPKK